MLGLTCQTRRSSAEGTRLRAVGARDRRLDIGGLQSGSDLLAFSQPVRLGDRITVGDQTGVVDEITLSYTALQTDEGRRVFVPNRDMVSSTLVNNSVADPRRLVTVEVPVRLNASLAAARRKRLKSVS